MREDQEDELNGDRSHDITGEGSGSKQIPQAPPFVRSNFSDEGGKCLSPLRGA